MTTFYIVAYAHPQLVQVERCCRCRVDSDMGRDDLIDQLKKSFPHPEYVEDLGKATLLKVGKLSVDDRCMLLTTVTGQ